MAADSVVPVLDLHLSRDPTTRPLLIAQLKHALLDIGFLYVKNFDIPVEVFASLKQESYNFFNLPLAEKMRCEMTKSPHFLGYTRLANEITALQTDWREQIDLGTELPPPQSPDEPIYHNLVGPNMWPDTTVIPGFRPTIEDYLARMTAFSKLFISLVTEAIGLPPGTFDQFFKANQQVKMKIIAYPDTDDPKNEKANPARTGDTAASGQGVGPHRDSDFLTYIYQATQHESLQVQTFQGEWLTVSPIPNTLVVNVGQTLEALTHGVCVATIHRVVSPLPGLGTRLSIPVFQTIDIDSFATQVVLPEWILEEKRKRDKVRKLGGIGFQFKPDLEHPVGYAVFLNRLKSHQDVARIWYPAMLDKVLEQIKQGK
ncbi:hypothetical protein BABINDRAFT_9805 [Babjeviella inositovora NRRL Y-12698]|uniref:Fe2OG dioxygenase domain-containing protein n=1 Tax=Babjeviella inositovora NRRL Y-12698 TaxID=984486 RepID=A0A1E3QJG9_9ASCO|nr:uncharacterized protein BABINDRAFT_9805 [Babjeviella inositovora NRRL Y-12698]ODQ77819.1 hypothetical protein BABINDRAFT_9805 [Babjeviella inositovora NRRL Y-12698]